MKRILSTFLALLSTVAFGAVSVPPSDITPVPAGTVLGRSSEAGSGRAQSLTAGSGITIANGTISSSGGGGGAPTTATYITQTPDASLSAEQALSALSSGILFSTTTTGVVTSLGPILSSANGGTSNGFTAFTGPLTTAKTFTLPNASATILTSNTPVTVAQGGTGLNSITTFGVMTGNGTGPVITVSPGSSGNVLTSNGTGWYSGTGGGGGGGGGVTANGTLTGNRIILGGGGSALGPMAAVTNGKILVGNSTSGNFDIVTTTNGNGITVTGGAGSLAIATTVRQVVVADTTGAVDASGGFNTAINAVAAAGGGTVFVPYGTYKVSGISGERILLKGGVRLDFAAGVTISSGNHTATSVIMDINNTTASTISNVVIDGNGLTITGNRTSTFTQYGIQLTTSTGGDVLSGVTIRNVKIANTRTDGITIGGNAGAQPSNILVQNVWVDNAYRNGGSAIHGTQISFEDCRFTNTNGSAPGAGFDVEPDTGLSVTDIYFTRCQFTSNAANGLYAQTARVNRVNVTDCQAVTNGGTGIVINLPSGDATLTSSVARSNTSDGFYIEALNASVTGCISASNGGDGFKAAGSNAATYANCEAYSNAGTGFDILYQTAYTGTQNFVGCSAHDNTTRGVSFNGAVQASFTGGSVYKNPGDGVQFYGAQNCILANNYIAQNGTGTDLGGDNVIIENNSGSNQVIGNKVSQALRFFSGTATAGGAATVTLPATRYALVDSYYNGMTVRITGGTGSGQTKTISSYVAATGVVTVASSWSTNPDNTSTLQITAANRPRYGIRLNSANNANQVIANDTLLSGGTGTTSDAGTGNTVAEFTGLTVFGGLLTTQASATSTAGLRLPHGSAPTSPTDGDLWSTTAGFYGRVNGATVGPFGTGAGSGNVTGPGSSTDNSIVTWNSTTGTSVRNNPGVTITSNNIVTSGNVTANVVTANTITVADMNTTNLTVSGALAGATAHGQIYIGNVTNGFFTKNVLTAGTGVTITNGANSITINATGSGNVTGSSLTANAVVLGGGSNAITVASSLGTTGHPLVSAGAGAPPAFGILEVIGGGSGVATLTANAVITGNGTGSVTSVSPGTSGNILTSNGTAWASVTPAGAAITTNLVGYGNATNVLTSEAAFGYNPTTNILTVGGLSLGAGSEVSTIGALVDAVDGTTPLNNIIQTVAAGTAYTLTASYASADFGTTDPVLTLANAGTYAVYVNIQFEFVGATYAAFDSVSAKLRRTNNTAADLTGATFSTFLPVVTTLTSTGPSLQIGPIKYTTTNTDDSITVQVKVGSTPSAGSITASNVTITAARAY